LKIHGFPDLSMAWRYQIPQFLKLGFRVVCPDCIGYGRSVSCHVTFGKKLIGSLLNTHQDAPIGSIEPYTFKSHAVDFHELCKSLGCENVVVGAHDW
jgi:pimeloyl-ACP methyl ester carboxylesterase